MSGDVDEDDLKEKRKKLDEQEKLAAIENAKLVLKKNPAIRNVGDGKISPGQTEFLQLAFSKEGIFAELNLHDGKFPGNTYLN